MSNSAKKEYLAGIRKRYFPATKAEKSLILDELCSVCRFNRKYAIRLISKKQTSYTKEKGSPKKYHSQAILEFLKDLWRLTNLACAERLKAAIPLWLPHYHLHSSNHLSEKDVRLLLEISPSTIKRLLRRLKSKYKKFGLSTAKPGSLLKKQVPIKLNQWDESRPGFIEADTVAHCGSSISGQFVYTLNVVDIAQVGQNREPFVWGKGKTGVFDALKNIRKALPFKVLLALTVIMVESCLIICCLNILLIRKTLFNTPAQENTRRMIMHTLKKRIGLTSDNLLATGDLINLRL